jgi:hypothetical protein
VGVKKKYSSILRLSLVVSGGATTSYLRRMVPICSLNSMFARFIPAQLDISRVVIRALLSGADAKGEKVGFHFRRLVIPS